jgi:Zn-dependent protease with chaperone function
MPFTRFIKVTSLKIASSLLLLLFCIFLFSNCMGAQAAQPTKTEIAQRAPVGHTVAYTLPPDKLQKAQALYMLEGKLRIIDLFYGFATLLAILYLGIAARYRIWAEKASRLFFVQALIFVPLLLLTLALLDLPLTAYGHHISLQYGLSVQQWGSWFADFLKEQAISIVLLTPVLWLLNLFIRHSPRRWWLYSWLVALPLMIFVVFIAPVVIDPMFNKFEPLDKNHPQLVSALEQVVQRGGLAIPRDRMFEMKASEKVTTLNAYVTGFGASKRVVVWDNTMQKMTTPETLFVFGHEMGHYVLHHIVQGIIVTALSLLLGLYLVYRLSAWTLPRFGPQWGVRNLADWTAMAMIFLLFSVLGLIAEPLGNTFSRHIEHEADIYGLEVTHGINPNPQEVAAHSFQVLGELSLDYPYPSKWVVLWFFNHPSIPDRVRFAQEYDPWSKGEQPRFVK